MLSVAQPVHLSYRLRNLGLPAPDSSLPVKWECSDGGCCENRLADLKMWVAVVFLWNSARARIPHTSAPRNQPQAAAIPRPLHGPSIELSWSGQEEDRDRAGSCPELGAEQGAEATLVIR